MLARAAGAAAFAIWCLAAGCEAEPGASLPGVLEEVALPPVEAQGTFPLEQAIAQRRSVREYGAAEVTREELARLLWAAQGVTDGSGHRSAPSAGALYPLEWFAVSRDGIGHYIPGAHRLDVLRRDDARRALGDAAMGQNAVTRAPLVLVVAGVVSRTRSKYGERAERYVAMEAGHSAQNVLLEATSLGLGAVTIGAFEDESVRDVLALPAGYFPYYLIAVGRVP